VHLLLHHHHQQEHHHHHLLHLQQQDWNLLEKMMEEWSLYLIGEFRKCMDH
jgi:hypothetical protein